MVHRFAVEVRGEERELTVEALEGGRYRVTHAGRSRVVDARKIASDGSAATWSLLPEGGGAAALVDVDGRAPELMVTVGNLSVPLKLVDARRKLASHAASGARASGPTAVRSPMPGKIVKVLVQVGDEVKAGQGIAVVEAMKMENELKAPRDGKITEIGAREGQAVESGQTLATIS
jgi:biotin carboxyl carrier protein